MVICSSNKTLSPDSLVLVAESRLSPSPYSLCLLSSDSVTLDACLLRRIEAIEIEEMMGWLLVLRDQDQGRERLTFVHETKSNRRSRPTSSILSPSLTLTHTHSPSKVRALLRDQLLLD